MIKMACLVPVLSLFLVPGYVVAEPPQPGTGGCPAHEAAKAGFTLLQELHTVMAPAWHSAYPIKDYAALRDAISQFDAMLPKLKEITPAFKTVERKEKFNAARAQFTELVTEGKSADDTQLYASMPKLHDSFETMAYYIMPLQFTEFAALQAIVNQMAETYLTADDLTGIKESLKELTAANAKLQEAALPEDLKSVAEQAGADIADIGKSCQELEKAAGAISIQTTRDGLTRLKDLCNKFEQNYI